jgi:hypothetical protein
MATSLHLHIVACEADFQGEKVNTQERGGLAHGDSVLGSPRICRGCDLSTPSVGVDTVCL